MRFEGAISQPLDQLITQNERPAGSIGKLANGQRVAPYGREMANSISAHPQQLRHFSDTVDVLRNHKFPDELHGEESLSLARLCINRRIIVCEIVDGASRYFRLSHGLCLSRLNPGQHAVPGTQPFFKGWADGRASISSYTKMGLSHNCLLGYLPIASSRYLFGTIGLYN